jgi:hypothetical protein
MGNRDDEYDYLFKGTDDSASWCPDLVAFMSSPMFHQLFGPDIVFLHYFSTVRLEGNQVLSALKSLDFILRPP